MGSKGDAVVGVWEMKQFPGIPYRNNEDSKLCEESGVNTLVVTQFRIFIEFESFFLC